MEGTIGEIRIFGGNFAPLSWSFCDGSTLSISTYTALFSVIGTTYGGDGQTTFQVPDMRGRIPVGTGQGPGLSNYSLGEVAGTENVTMSVLQMPAHTHSSSANIIIPAYSEGGTSGSPTNTRLAGLSGAYATESPDTTLKPFTANVPFTNAGGSMPFSVLQPVTALNYIICLEGIFPSRN